MKISIALVFAALTVAAPTSRVTAGPILSPTPRGFATTGLVDDIRSGPQGSQPHSFLAVANALYFVANDSSPTNAELWRTQGDFSTTAMVFDFDGSGSPDELTEINGTVYFVASETDLGRELWKTTGQGATLVRDINPGSFTANPRGLTAVGDKLFFSANDGASGTELWVLDTVTGVSNRVADLNPGSGSTVFFDNPTGGPNFEAVGDLLFFAADNGEMGLELWRSNGDGAPDQTFRIDINIGAGSSMNFSLDPVVASPVPDMANVDGKLLFAADDGINGRELWISDGSEAGTHMVADIRPGPGGSNPLDFVYFDNDMLFVANNGANGREIWISNGEEAGTMMLADINPGSASSSPGWLTQVGGVVYFQALEPSTGVELWVSNGSPSGTEMAADINPGTGSSFPGKAVSGADGLAYFSADDGVSGSELWRSNGAPENSERMADINPGIAGSGIFHRLAGTDDRVYFQADDGLSGSELWSVSVCPSAQFKGPGTCLAAPGPVPRKRSAVLYSGKLIAASEFAVHFNASREIFLHAAVSVGSLVTALDGTIFADPDPGGIGFGLVKDLWMGEIYDLTIDMIQIGDIDFDGLRDFEDPFPTLADAPQGATPPNGIPDAYEDQDQDGLTRADEHWFGSQYDPTKFDTDGNGDSDSVDYLIRSRRKDFWILPALINAYHSSVDQMHLRAALERANVILRQAKIALGLSGFRSNVSAGDNGADGRVVGLAEYRQIVRAGLAEVQASTAGGLKISVMSDAFDSIRLPASPPDPADPGKLVNSDGAASPGTPVMIVQQGDSVDLTARTIAHELGHMLRLEHVHNGPADAPGNVMTEGSPQAIQFVISNEPDEGLENVVFSRGDLAKVAASPLPRKWGRGGTRESPARRTEYGSGAAADAAGDQLVGEPDYLDLQSIQVASEGRLDRVHWLLEVGAELPSAEGDLVVFALLIDIDDDANTGSLVLGQPGIDREIQLYVFEHAEGRGTVAQKTTYPAGTSSLITPAPTVSANTIAAEGEFAEDLRLGEIIDVYVRKDVLDLSADLIPVTVVAFSATGVVADTAQLVYNRVRWQTDPLLVLDQEFATPGAMVTFTVSGLTPGDPFELTVGGQLAATGMLDGSGGFNGAFTAQGAISEDVQFVIIADQSNRFAESVIVIPRLVFGDGFE